MMNHLLSSSKKGLTLTEIMLATFILAMAMLPIVGVFSQGHKLSQKDMRRIEAIHLAESTMNKLLKLPFSQVPNGTHGADLVAASGTVELGKVAGTIGTSFNVSALVKDYPVTFEYNPVDINDPGYDPDNSATWVFLALTSNGAKFDGSSPKCPIMVKQYEVSVAWEEPNKVVPEPIKVQTLKANLEE